MMTIVLDRRHTVHLDADDQVIPIQPYLFDRLWRGEPDAAMPELADQRVRSTVLHIERFTSPPRITAEHYPVLTFGTGGNIDLELQHQQLHAEVDRLEATDYAPASAAPTPAAAGPSEMGRPPGTHRYPRGHRRRSFRDRSEEPAASILWQCERQPDLEARSAAFELVDDSPAPTRPPTSMKLSRSLPAAPCRSRLSTPGPQSSILSQLWATFTLSLFVSRGIPSFTHCSRDSSGYHVALARSTFDGHREWVTGSITPAPHPKAMPLAREGPSRPAVGPVSPSILPPHAPRRKLAMLEPIMEPKPPDARRLRPPAASAGSAAVHFPAPDDLPPPYVDTRLVEPETRQEMIHGRLIHAVPANPEHGDEHTELDYLIRGYRAPGHTASTDLLTHAGPGSDFATDTCIRRSGIDPRTGSRYIEALAFEVVNTQSVANMIQRARMLSTSGVRRIFAIFVKTDEVCEWSLPQDRFLPLDLDDAIEDSTLVRPLPIRALFDAAVADDAVVDALEARGNARLAEKVARGEARGRTEGLLAGIDAACDLLEIPLGPVERRRMEALDVTGLEALLVELKTHRRWPNG